jgi:hypothetical protein
MCGLPWSRAEGAYGALQGEKSTMLDNCENGISEGERTVSK